MPGSPDFNKGEGLIRGHDLLEVLRLDIEAAYFALETERSNQFLRRCLVRAIFSFIEAVIECIKVEIRSTVRSGDYSKSELTEKELETLGPLHVIASSPGKFLPLDQNLKRTFKLAAKVWYLNFRLATGDKNFADFCAAKLARNRLTHPRTFYDVEVTDDDMECHTIAGMWVQKEFQRLFKARIESIIQDLPDEDRQGLLKLRSDIIAPPN